MNKPDMASAPVVRRAGVDDAAEIAELLHDFNTEFSDPTPGVATLTERAQQLLEDEEIAVLLSSEPSVGLACFAFDPRSGATLSRRTWRSSM